MRRPVSFLWIAAGTALVVVAAFFISYAYLFLYRDDPRGVQGAASILGWGLFISSIVFVVFLVMLYRMLLRPLDVLAREARIVAGPNPAHEVHDAPASFLGDLPGAVGELGIALFKARREITQAMASHASGLEDTKRHLETVLSSLNEGVIVCDSSARLMFYNPAARRAFRDNPAMGIGRSLYLLCPSGPIADSLDVLRQQQSRQQQVLDGQQEVSFVCSTLDNGALLDCRISLLPVLPDLAWGFVFTCQDISSRADASGRGAGQLRATIKRMRAPLANLSVSAEAILLQPPGSAEASRALHEGLAREASLVVQEFNLLAKDVEALESQRFSPGNVYTGDLIACVARRLQGRGVALTMSGEPLWVRADVHWLLLLLETLAMRLSEFTGSKSLEIDTLLGDRRVYFDFYWHGRPVPQPQLDRWGELALEPQGQMRLDEVLEEMGSALWSKSHVTPGYAFLRFPLALSPSQWEPPRPALPPRPVFYDFTFADRVDDAGVLDRPLDELTYVVFDTETTGLSPLGGDEVVSIAGVKIANRGLLLSEAFDQIVDPRRPIPPASVRFHGITEDMAKGKPTIEEALRAFKQFVGDAVLVGHNAAFDMKFVKMKEPAAGVRFDGPILDTLALSVFLHDHTPEHSLDAIARRMGVEIAGRHTALGDSIITAQIFMKFMYLLKDRGVHTPRQALEASQR